MPIKLNISRESEFGIKRFLAQILQAFSTMEMLEIMCNGPQNVTAIARPFVAKHFIEGPCKSKTKATIKEILKKKSNSQTKFQFPSQLVLNKTKTCQSVEITIGLSLVTG